MTFLQLHSNDLTDTLILLRRELAAVSSILCLNFVFVFHDSCLIARNLLNGLKTCWEVFQYITHSENGLACEAGDAGTLGEGYSKFDCSGTVVRILLLVYGHVFVSMQVNLNLFLPFFFGWGY